MNLSKVTAIGKVLDQPESRSTQEGTALSVFTIETSNQAKVKCNLWGKMSESAGKINIGDLLLINGNLITHSQQVEGAGYSNKTFEIQVRELQKVDGQTENLTAFSGRDEGSSRSSAPAKASASADADDDLPF